ncbi:MAG: hypothetical protein HYX92_16735 [Chloroflexi bacterium]|nr:hypothetical protein [Chloroflexota bacterium]
METHFLIPICEDASFGSGKLHPFNRWEDLQRDLFSMFGGWRLGPGLTHGVWRDPDTGKPVGDESKQYFIALDEMDVPALRRYLAENIAMRFRQRVIYFFNGRTVEFVEAAESGS